MNAGIRFMNKKNNSPILRFREFSGQWVSKSLDSVVEIIDCKHRTPIYVEIGVPVISPGSIKWGEIDLNSPTKRVTDKEYQSLMDHCSPKKGDLVFSRNQSIGVATIVMNNNKFVLGQDTVLIQAKTIHPIFNYYRIQSESVQALISKLSGGSTFSRINLKDIRKLKVSITELKPEQQKIATFLSSVDEKIQQLTRKKELLEQYKKGVMQQLFSGKLRFKDEKGKGFPKWEEFIFGNLFTFHSTNSLSRDNLNYNSGTVKNIHYGDIHTKFSNQFDINKEQVPYINSEIDISNTKNDNYCFEGDLVIADASEDYKDIGKTIELIKLNGEKLVAGLHTFLARPDKTKLHKGFCCYLVQANYVRKQIMTIAQGTKVLSISSGRLSNITLKIPTLTEQKLISSLLSSIDAKVQIVDNQISQTQTFKKGLLQQMFV